MTSNSGPHSERFITKMKERHELHHVSFRNVPKEFQLRHPSVHFHILDASFPIMKLEDDVIAYRNKGILSRTLHSVKFLLASLRSIFRSWMFLRAILRECQPDILCGGYIQRDGFVSALTRFHPFILMPFASDAVILPFENPVMRIGTKWVVKRADRIACDSLYVRDSLLRLVKRNPDDIAVFPWGIEQDIFDFSASGEEVRNKLGWAEKTIVINTRSLNPPYDPLTFVRVFPSLCSKYPELRVIMCGKGELEQECKDYAKSQGIDEKIHFAGYLPREDLVSYYAASDIYVSCSISDGSSNALLEAMTMGLPAIVTRVVSNEVWIKHGENGYLFTFGSVTELAGLIENLVRDKELRRQFSRRNREIGVEKADWNKNYEILERVFTEVTSRTGR